MSETYLVTGANRGIGLEYVHQCLARGDRVIATARDPERATALADAAAAYPEQCRVERLDVADEGSVAAFAERIADEAIDVLINNAGLYGGSWANDAQRQSVAGMDYALWEEILRVNVIAPFRLTVELRAQLARGSRKLVVMISSDLGSIAANGQGQSHAYRTSKAALNMLTKGLAIDLKAEGLAVVSMAPGWVQTDLGGSHATWSAADSVGNQLKVIAGLGLEDSGRFVNLLGEQVPW